MKNVPLTPEAGGVCVADVALEPADLIVSTTSQRVSGVIRGATGSFVSHAILYVGRGEVIEAIGEGVVARPLAVALGDAVLAVAYRYPELPPASASLIVTHARSFAQQKAKYDHSGAMGGGARANLGLCIVVLGVLGCVAARRGALNNPDRFYCSELVLEAYRRAGVPLSDINPSVSTPQDIVEIHAGGNLEYVGHLKP